MPNNVGYATQDEVHLAIERAKAAGTKVTADQAFQQLKTLSNPVLRGKDRVKITIF